MALIIGLGILLALLHFQYGIAENNYRKWWYGGLVHFIGGLFLAAFFLRSSAYVSFLPFFLAAIWELWEYACDRYFPKLSKSFCWYSRSWNGAWHDIMWTWLGISALYFFIP